MTVYRYSILFGLVLGLVIGFSAVVVRHITEKTAVQESVSAHIQNLDVVRTQEEQERGLGGRSDIPHDYGMLFVFTHPQKVGFWMKDMLVPIDIIWLGDEGNVIAITERVAPSTYPALFYPPQPVRYVLETRAGEAALKGWTVGTKIVLPENVQK